ncbi:MAG: hypothetical protein ACI9CD_000445 [Candidatus Deianiraeaceae bacterium]|jgi:hypothetical protein
MQVKYIELQKTLEKYQGDGLQVKCLDQLESQIQWLHKKGIQMSPHFILLLQIVTNLKQEGRTDEEVGNGAFISNYIQKHLPIGLLMVKYLESKTNATNTHSAELEAGVQLVHAQMNYYTK